MVLRPGSGPEPFELPIFLVYVFLLSIRTSWTCREQSLSMVLSQPTATLTVAVTSDLGGVSSCGAVRSLLGSLGARSVSEWTCVLVLSATTC